MAKPLKKLFAVLTLVKGYLFSVAKDPLAVEPNIDSPKGSMAAPEAGKVVFASILAYIAANALPLATLFGAWAPAVASLAAALLQVYRLFNNGLPPAKYANIPGHGLGVLSPIPGKWDQIGFYGFKGEFDPNGVEEPAPEVVQPPDEAEQKPEPESPLLPFKPK